VKIKNIALSAVIVSIASIPTICFANIGDTQEQSVLHQLAWEMGWKKVSGEDGKH
jgi:hypothetical protein